MEKVQTREDRTEVEQSEGSRKEIETAVGAPNESVEHVHAKTFILLAAIVGVYGVQVLHLTGSGLLSNNLTSVVGGSNKSTWVVSPIAIAAGILGPPVSQAADYWGRKPFVVVLTISGMVGCFVVSRADTFGSLIAGQSIGALACGAQPLIHAIASEIIPRKYRPLAQSSTNSAAALGGIVGLLMGGALVRTDPSGFRTYFYITAGLYALCVAIIFWLYHPPPRELQQQLTHRQKLARLDWIGYGFFFPGLVLFSFALASSSGVYPWKSATIIAPLVVGALLLIAFGIYEWKGTREGILHHDLFSRGRNFAIAEMLILVEGLVFFCATQYYGFEVSILYDKDLFQAGLDYTVGWARLYSVDPPELISITSGLMIGTRSVGGTIALAIYAAIFSGTLNDQLPAKVTEATVPLGFNPKYLGELLGGLTTGNATLLGEIPGVTPTILKAAGSGVKQAYTLAFRYCWITAAAFAAVAVIGSLFIVDPKKEFNAHIDAPVETEDELKRGGIAEKLHHRPHQGSPA